MYPLTNPIIRGPWIHIYIYLLTNCIIKGTYIPKQQFGGGGGLPVGGQLFECSEIDLSAPVVWSRAPCFHTTSCVPQSKNSPLELSLSGWCFTVYVYTCIYIYKYIQYDTYIGPICLCRIRHKHSPRLICREKCLRAPGNQLPSWFVWSVEVYSNDHWKEVWQVPM